MLLGRPVDVLCFNFHTCVRLAENSNDVVGHCFGCNVMWCGGCGVGGIARVGVLGVMVVLLVLHSWCC